MGALNSQPLHTSYPSPLEELLWDTGFFGFPVARLITAGQSVTILEALLHEAQERGIRLLYLVILPTETAAAAVAKRAGALLVDRKITFRMPIQNVAQRLTLHPAIRPTTTYTPQLESLAQQSGQYSRFRLDSNFTLQVFSRLYSQWLRNALTGTMARQVLAWHNAKGEEQGMITLGEKNGRLAIGLLAVDANMRGRGVGQALVAAASTQGHLWGYSELEVVTQRANAAACSFYQKCGFSIEQEEHIYHLWFA